MKYLSEAFCPANKSMFAKVVAASRSALTGKTVYTVHLRYPRIIHGELMTHRVFSRNARSSRAVPIKTMLAEVRNEPFVPWHWTKNQKGMQGADGWEGKILLKGTAGQFTEADVPIDPASAWLHGRDFAADLAESFMDAEYHKQTANRLLEPFSWIDVLVTSTEWNNFFHLRDHSAAENHLQDLARITEIALAQAEVTILQPGEWHLPFITDEDWDFAYHYLEGEMTPLAAQPAFDAVTELLRKISAARCARISYSPFDGDASYPRELARYDLLVTDERIHASPVEHQCSPDRQLTSDVTVYDLGGNIVSEISGELRYESAALHGNLVGFIQGRKLLPNEALHG